MYVDTEGTFRPERVKAIAERFGVDPIQVLEVMHAAGTVFPRRAQRSLVRNVLRTAPSAHVQNMAVARAYTHEHQQELLTVVSARMASRAHACVHGHVCMCLCDV